MNRVRSPHALAALARRAGWGRNVLRRRVDRIDNVVTLVTLGLVVVAVAVSVVVGAQAGRRVLAAGSATHDREVTATLLADSPITVPLGGAPAGPMIVPVPARWSVAGRTYQGYLRVGEGAQAGATVPIWIDAAGDQVDPPVSTFDAVERGGITGLVVLAVAGALLGTAFGLMRRQLNRARLRAWDAEWRRTGPRWTLQAD